MVCFYSEDSQLCPSSTDGQILIMNTVLSEQIWKESEQFRQVKLDFNI